MLNMGVFKLIILFYIRDRGEVEARHGEMERLGGVGEVEGWMLGWSLS